MQWSIENFNGIAPRYDAAQLPPSMAQIAKDCDIDGGNLRLLNAPGKGDCGGGTVTHSPVKIAVPSKPTVEVSETAMFDPSTSQVDMFFDNAENYKIIPIYKDFVKAGDYIDVRFTMPPTTFVYTHESSLVTSTVKYIPEGGVYDHFILKILGQTIKTNAYYNLENVKDTENAIGSIDLFDGFTYAGSILLKQVILPKRSISGTFVRNFYGQLMGDGKYIYTVKFYSHDITFRFIANFIEPRDRVFSYMLTYENADGKEGPPSAVSDMITKRKLNGVIVKFNPMATPGDSTPSKIHIYRTESGTEPEKFNEVTTVNYGVQSYLDKAFSSATMGKGLPVYSGTVPSSPMWGNRPDGLTKTIQMPSMFYCGYKDKTLYFSGTRENNHEFPEAFALTMDYDIYDIQSSGNSIIVLTKGGCYAIYGQEPYEHWGRQLTDKCCVSRNAVAKLDEFIYYVSPDGIVRASGEGASLITKTYFTTAQWRALTPSTMTLDTGGDKLFCFTANVDAYNYIFDFQSNRIDVIQTLYKDNTFTATSLQWKSQKKTFNVPIAFKIGRVIASSYASVIFKLYRNGTLACTINVTSSDAFRLPRLESARYWEMEVVSTSTIDSISVAQSEDEYLIKE